MTEHTTYPKISYRGFIYWDIADLGFSHLYFSCKNYKKLAHYRITKVVV
jgi:hypothetical protein